MNIILCGFKSCGKSSVGKALADKLHRPFIDTDIKMLATSNADTIPKLFNELGDTGFRKLESECIQQLTSLKNSIISLGGGSLMDPNNVSTVKSVGKLIFLNTPYSILKERIVKELHSLAVMKSTYDVHCYFEAREPIFRENADAIIEVGSSSVAEIVLMLEEVIYGQ